MKKDVKLLANLTKNVNERRAFEVARKSSESKVALLDRAFKRFQNADVLAYFVANDLTFDFMNKATADNKVFNMKALDKVARVALTLQTSRDTLDNFTRAIVRNTRALNEAVTNNDLQAMLCASVESDKRARFVRNAVLAKTAMTASSQFSSSRAALVVLNLASVANKSTRDELTTINTSVFSAISE